VILEFLKKEPPPSEDRKFFGFLETKNERVKKYFKALKISNNLSASRLTHNPKLRQ
jgi:hypothetical protein